MNIERVFEFMDRNAGLIILIYLVSGLAFFSGLAYVGYRILKHVGVFG